MLNMLYMPFALIALISLAAFFKWKKRRDLIIFICSAALIVLMTFDSASLPVFSVQYDTPEAVYLQKYGSAGSEVLLTLEGESSALIAARKSDDKLQYGLVKKVGDQWTNTALDDNMPAALAPSAAAGIYIYRYAETGDYYIMLLGNGTGINSVSDSLNSVFHRPESFDSCFAYIPGFDFSYWIEINGERVQFTE